MWRAGRHMKRDIEGKLEASSAKPAPRAFCGVFAFTLLMITREGMETAMLMNALLFQVQGDEHRRRRASAGTLARRRSSRGCGRATATASTSRRFFQVTAVFLLVFVVQLLIYGFHELAEANIFPTAGPARGDRAVRPGRRLRPVPDLLLVVLPLAGWPSRACSTAPVRIRSQAA